MKFPSLKNLIKWLPFAVAFGLFIVVMYFFSKDLRRIINTFIKGMFKKCFHLSQ